ncbi:hypothetical protein, partial [Escherichia coli]|uniref:hypothetical protein n=1 Tax=Escherichia coli TaxID=562 RepID=UPI003D1F3436
MSGVECSAVPEHSILFKSIHRRVQAIYACGVSRDISGIGSNVGSVTCNIAGVGRNVGSVGNDSNLLIVFYVQIMPDDFV